MRKIKFRGLRIKGNGWLYGNLIDNSANGCYYIHTQNYYIEDIEAGWGEFEVDPKTVGQYTGYKDENDKYIYEDDILEMKFGRNIVVRWGIEHSGLSLWKHKIIGSIHENPELLEGNDG